MSKNINEKKIFDISLDDIYDKEVMRLLEDASHSLGKVNNLTSGALEYDFIVQVLKNIEALTSARIEGTTGNLKDLYAEQALTFERKAQLKLFSAINYKIAIEQLENIVERYSRVSLRLIRHIHKILTENDPATKGVPGKFRDGDVAIENKELGNFYPASHLKIIDFMERYVNEVKRREKMPVLLNAAISHYQFESIHPFQDGNGRTGRMLIVADLLREGSLDAPILNLSQYFELHRDKYLGSLRSVTEEGSYKKWVLFFLKTVKEQSLYILDLIGEFRNIGEVDKKVINEKVHSPAAPLILKHALNNLFITVPDTAEYLKDQKLKSADYMQVARTNIARLVDEKVLIREDFKFGRSVVYAHKGMKEHLLDKNNSSI